MNLREDLGSPPAASRIIRDNSMKLQFVYRHSVPGFARSLAFAAKADWSAMSYSIWVSASKMLVNPVCSDWPQPMPLTMRRSWSPVMDRRGSPGADHSAMGAGFCMSNLPFLTRMPRIAFVADLVIDHPVRGVAGVTPGA
jgi:hypothetical protein